MGDLSKLSDSAKVAFLMEALEDAAAALRFAGCLNIARRYDSYVREMRGEVEQEAAHG
uniref:Uncharacterized protein n=1 Tax=viral metagenome TaxID=1070528 RepID=A0A6M3M7R1_9ZZZZ